MFEIAKNCQHFEFAMGSKLLSCKQINKKSPSKIALVKKKYFWRGKFSQRNKLSKIYGVQVVFATDHHCTKCLS